MAFAISAVAKELGQQFEIGRFAAAGAGPENSNSGSRNCEPLWSSPRVGPLESRAGRERIVVLALRVAQRQLGSMLMALCSGLVLSLAGQTFTQDCSRCSLPARPGWCTFPLKFVALGRPST